MEIEDVVDRDRFEVFLDGLPTELRELAVQQIAFVALMSAIPSTIEQILQVKGQVEGQLRILPLWGCLLVSCLANSTPRQSFEVASAGMVADAADYVASNFSVTTGRPILSASAAANAAGAAVVFVEGAAIAYAAEAASAATGIRDFRNRIRQLLKNMKSETKLSISSLDWQEGVVEGRKKTWGKLRADQDGHWSFWISFYERIVAGKDIHAAKLAPILDSITEGEWLGDPAQVNVLFDDVLALYEADDVAQLITATPHGERVILDQDTRVFRLEPTDQVDPGFLPEIHAQIEDAIAIFGVPENLSNALHGLGEERDLLSSCLERHAARPVMILKTLSRVSNRIAVKVINGDCPTPQQDANVADLQDIIATTQVELIALSPEVRRYHEATRPVVQEDLVPIIAEAAQQVATSSDIEFAKLLTDAAFTLLDASADEYLRRHAQYWIVGSVARSYKAAKVVLDETYDVTKKAGFVGAGVTYVMNPAFAQWISTVLRGFL